MHPSIKHVLQFFKYDHLPENLRPISKACSELASKVADEFDGYPNPEVTVGLRKLLEAKDCFVRAKHTKETP